MVALYRFDLMKDPVEVCIEEIRKKRSCPRVVRDYACKLVFETVENLAAIDSQIRNHLQNWDFSRVSAVERAVLRIATYELIYAVDVPVKVSINEAIEIAKRYGTDGSGRFVNAILDAIYKGTRSDEEVGDKLC